MHLAPSPRQQKTVLFHANNLFILEAWKNNYFGCCLFKVKLFGWPKRCQQQPSMLENLAEKYVESQNQTLMFTPIKWVGNHDWVNSDHYGLGRSLFWIAAGHQGFGQFQIVSGLSNSKLRSFVFFGLGSYCFKFGSFWVQILIFYDQIEWNWVFVFKSYRGKTNEKLVKIWWPKMLNRVQNKLLILMIQQTTQQNPLYPSSLESNWWLLLRSPLVLEQKVKFWFLSLYYVQTLNLIPIF